VNLGAPGTLTWCVLRLVVTACIATATVAAITTVTWDAGSDTSDRAGVTRLMAPAHTPVPRDRVSRRHVRYGRLGVIAASREHPELEYWIDGKRVELPERVPAGSHYVWVKARSRSRGEPRYVVVTEGDQTTVDVDRLAERADHPDDPPMCNCGGERHHAAFFARHQSPDGHWRAAAYEEQCEPQRSAAVAKFDDAETTALVLLSFFAEGETHNSGSAKENIKGALLYLKELQDDNGNLAEDRANVRAHCIAALAYSEAYGLTGSMLFKETAIRAVAEVFDARVQGRGWKHHTRDADVDIETTMWAAMALRSARMSELELPREALAETRRCVEEFGAPVARPLLECAMLCVARMMVGDEPEQSIDLAAGMDRIAGLRLDAEALDTKLAWLGGLVAFHRSNAAWGDWRAQLRHCVAATRRGIRSDDTAEDAQAACGSWDTSIPTSVAEGRLRTTVYAHMAWAITYRYRRVFPPSRR